MSGLEVLAVAASVLQIAELGGQLSVKLFTFTRKIKNADKNIDSISQDIAATGAVLQQLGNELKKDEKLRLCSPEAIATAKSLMDECHKIFKDLNDAVNGTGKGFGTGAKMVLSLKQRVRYTFLEPQIDLLKANLEKLKSSLLVMLNVLIFAEQLKNQEALPILKDQRELLKCLVDEQAASQKQYDKVLKRLELLNLAQDNASMSQRSLDSTAVPNSTLTLVNTTSPSIGAPGSESLIPSLPAHLHDRAEEIFDHCRLVNTVIEEVNHAQYKIDLGIRYRTQELILDSHYNEWAHELENHRDHQRMPHTDRYQFLEHVPQLKRHWVRKASLSTRVPASAYISSEGARDVMKYSRKRRASPLPADVSRKRPKSTEQWALSEEAFSYNSPATPAKGSFDLEFSTRENSEILKDSDFDSFLNSGVDSAFYFDSDRDGLNSYLGGSSANKADPTTSFQLSTHSQTPLVSPAQSPHSKVEDSIIVRQGRPEPSTAEPSARETPSVHVGRPRRDSQLLSPSKEPAQARRKNLAGPEAESSIEAQRKKLETAYSDEAINTRNAEIQAKRDRRSDLRRQRQLREETRGPDEDDLVMLDKKQTSGNAALSGAQQTFQPSSSAASDQAQAHFESEEPTSLLESPSMLKINDTAQTSSSLPPEDPSCEPSTAPKQSRKPGEDAVDDDMPLSFTGYTYKPFNTQGEADNEIVTENKNNAASGPWKFSQSDGDEQYQPPPPPPPPPPPQAWSEPEPDALYPNVRNPYTTSSSTGTAADRRWSRPQTASNLAPFLCAERVSKSTTDTREKYEQALDSLLAYLDSGTENPETEKEKVESEVLRHLLREYTTFDSKWLEWMDIGLDEFTHGRGRK